MNDNFQIGIDRHFEVNACNGPEHLNGPRVKFARFKSKVRGPYLTDEIGNKSFAEMIPFTCIDHPNNHSMKNHEVARYFACNLWDYYQSFGLCPRNSLLFQTVCVISGYL